MNAKNNWMVLASIASCALITLFLCVWLNDQYAMEQYRLRKTAGDDVNRAVEKVTDTMMYKLMQQPLSMMDVPDSIRSTSFNIVFNDTITHTHHLDPEKKEPVKLIIQNKHVDRRTLVFSDKDADRPNEDVNALFSRGLKVFVNQLAEVTTNGNVTEITGQNLDTALFSRQLRTNWSNKQLQYGLNFHAGVPKNGTRLTVVRLFDKPVQVTLINLQSNAFKAILPELAFAVFLLIVLGASFIWMYRSWKKQVQLNALRMDFMHNMTHELKTPVSTVKVALEALNHYNRKTDPKVVEEYLQLMEHEINRLDTLVNNVMDNSWAEAKELQVQKTAVNVVSELHTFVERLRSKAEWQQAKMNLKAAATEVTLVWDPFHIEGVLNNLADNALKYAGPEVELTISLATHPDYVLILFSDNGPGVPENFRNEIFNPFVRVPQGDVHNVKGYGMGLSYCKKVMAAHDGSILYTENEQGGATFTLRFKR